MRLLHTADWHIGRQFHHQSLLEDQRHVLQQIVDLVRERQVDVVLVAGDIYDRSVPPAAAVALLDEVLEQLCLRLEVPVIMIGGNHDGAERLAFGARHLAQAGLHIITRLQAEPEPILLGAAGDEVAFFPIPYAEPVTVREVLKEDVSSHDQAMAQITARIRQRRPREHPCVVMAHCYLSGGEASDSERPLSIGGAEWVSPAHFSTFDYAALGHLHGRQFRGQEHVRYAGSILKYSFSECNQHKSVTLVDLDRSGVTAIDQVALQPLRDMRILEGELDSILAGGEQDPQADDYLLVRLSDTRAILDVMGKLRAVYPNVLHLERPGLMPSGESSGASREQLGRGEMAMFRDFYRQVRGEELGPEAEALIAGTLQQIHRGED